ncbi:HAD-IC family P-type ATPase [Clostridium sp. DJ247]|uniref:HAD-IC family P-type ATPase n=1 Tax=Clostridium sp. DJ247 TaxID=2726188 RepID=UPI001629C06B|nr:HAD-IC family P-type ATPase [Clostridium sp. DJ247]MBC2581318.1 cation-translocating P-type ATPase [Clostridium sp. DJ247]
MKELSVLPGRVRFKSNKAYRNKQLAEYIDMYMENLYGIKYSDVNYNTGTILVVYDEKKTNLELIKNSIEQVLTSDINYNTETFKSYNLYYKTKKRKEKVKTKFILSSLIYLFLKVKHFVFGKFFLSSSIGMLEAASLITIMGGYPLLKSIYNKFTKRIHLHSDMLLRLAAVSFTILRESTEGLFLIVLVDFSDYIKLSAELKCERLLKHSMVKPPNTAWIITNNGDEMLTLVQSLEVGDIISVNKGEVVPVDGEVLEGKAVVNNLYYTGQPIVSAIQEKNKVYEGMIVLSGQLKVCVQRIPEIFNKNDLPFESLRLNEKVVKFQNGIVPFSLGLATISYLFTGNMLDALSIILILCPASSQLALSTGISNYIYLLSKYHIYLRNPNTFEKIVNTDSIVFDKTGTLTNGNMSEMQETIREGTYELINQLKLNGITNISMLTGDYYDKAKYVSDELEITNMYVNCNYEEKLKIIEEQKSYNTVMMVGDGVNDVLAMRAADVSVSFADSSCDKIKLNSDCVIFEENANRLSDLIILSKAAYNNIDQNIKIANLYNIIFGTLAFLGRFDTFAAKSIDTINSILVLILNERIKWITPAKKTKYYKL